MAVDSILSGKAVFEVIVRQLIVKAVIESGRQALVALGNVERDYGEHLRQSFDRCSRVRTILNRDESVSLLSLYVHLKFEDARKRIIDDYNVIENFTGGSRIVVSGIGGGGKTMFMKYIWISLFETDQSTIPLFVELRRFNDLTSEDFTAFLFRTIVDPKSKVQPKDFEKGLDEGAFSLIMDGFDEINEERRGLVELEILRIARTYPKVRIIVSGRPDDRFQGWQSFSTYRVQPLTKPQVVDLIGRLDYDIKIKKKFIQRIKKDLFTKHSSFLSSPLLATMMLLTFDQFADIPEKIYLFYDQAFDTLFAKHDATKEAYKRKTYSNLPIDVFKKLLAYFCLISYYENSIKFSEDEVRSYISKAVRMLAMPIDANAFLQDLQESVCILQRDGLLWTFTHRSFQEYFAAYCLSNLVTKRMADIIPHVIGRVQDQVLSMCFDMNQENLETEYLGPVVRRLSSYFESIQADNVLESYLRLFDCFVIGNSYQNGDGRIFLHSTNPDWVLLMSLPDFYPKHFPTKQPEMTPRADGTLLRESGIIEGDFNMYSFDIDGLKEKDQSEILKSAGILEARSKLKIGDLRNLHLAKEVVNEVKGIISVDKEILSRAAKRTKSIDQIFSL